MGNEVSAGRAVKRSSLDAGAEATAADSTNAKPPAAKRPRTAIAAATGQLALGTSHGLETGLQKAAAPVSLPDVIIQVPSVLKYMNKTDAQAVFRASNPQIRAAYSIAQLEFLTEEPPQNEELPQNGELAKNKNHRFLPTVDKLKVNLKLLVETHPDKSMSRHALGLIVKLKEVINRPGSEEITLARLGELALATLDHLNDAGDDDGDYFIDIKTQMNPDQLQQVIDLLGTLPADHPERRKINVLEFHLRSTQEDMRDSIQDIQNNRHMFRMWSPDTHDQIQNDYDVAFAVLQQIPQVFDHVGPKFQADRDMVLLVLQWQGTFARLSPELQADREVTMRAVSYHGFALRYARGGLRGDHRVVLQAVQTDGTALQYAIPRLQDDPTIVLAAVEQNPRAISWVGPLCRNLPEVLQAAGIQTD